MQSLVEIGPVVLKKKTLKFLQCISLFHYYLPLEKDGDLHLYKLNLLYPRMYCAKLKLAHWFWRKRSSNFVNVFRYFVLFLIGKGPGPPFEQT